jgi:hypothetical protein
VEPAEAEEVFLGRLYVRRTRLGRYLVLGRAGTGRLLFVIVERKPGGVIRVVTARDMDASERRLYERRRK